MRHLLAVPLLLLATPALAQFPPPGVYDCVNADHTPAFTLTMFVAGDYSLKGQDGNSRSGQVASAGNSVNPLSGPLKDMGLSGEFGDGGDGPWYRFQDAEKRNEISCR